jgi:hypothetical protein
LHLYFTWLTGQPFEKATENKWGGDGGGKHGNRIYDDNTEKSHFGLHVHEECWRKDRNIVGKDEGEI